MNGVGALIRALRKDAGESLEVLGDALDKPASTVSRWETGKNRPPDSALIQIAQRYRVTFIYGPHGVQLGYLEAA